MQQCSLASTNQTNPKYSLFGLVMLRELWQAHIGALYIELEGQRVKTYKSHFLIVLRIQFHTRRHTLNIQPSQIDLPAASIN